MGHRPAGGWDPNRTHKESERSITRNRKLDPNYKTGGPSFVPSAPEPTQSPTQSPTIHLGAGPTHTEDPNVIDLTNKKPSNYGSVQEQLSRPAAKVGLATAAVLATTLAALTGVGLATGAFARGATGVALTTGARTTAGLAPNAVRAATGRVVPALSTKGASGYLNEVVGVGARTIATNTKTAALQSSYISKVFAGMKNPLALAGVLVGAIGFQTMMVPNEKGDAIASLGYGISAAVKAGDMEGAAKMQELMTDLANPSVMEKLEAMIPFWGYIAAVTDKIKANKMVGDIAMSRLQNQVNETGTTGTPNSTQDWNAIFAAQLDRQEAEREADAKANMASIKAWAEAKAAEREADAKYWAEKIAEADERARIKAEANEKYWLEVYKQRENSAPSALNFGLL